jgi:hypothetical protein
VQNAVNRLADELGVLAVDIQVVDVEQVAWRDSSLEVSQPEEAWEQGITIRRRRRKRLRFPVGGLCE